MSEAQFWRISDTHSVDLREPRLVGIINTTPDSFSDGGLAHAPADAAARAVAMAHDGADALDIGAESTRPGASAVSPDEQIARAIPAIRAIRDSGVALPITIDTTSADVAEAALQAGASAINDVSAGEADPRMLPLAADHGCSIMLMHRLRVPEEDSYSDQYADEPEYTGGVVEHVRSYLLGRAATAVRAGVEPESIVLDPGFGFGKSVEQNVQLMRSIGLFIDLGYPILAGVSRKSFIGAIAGETDPERRDPASVGAAVTMAESKVRIFRVHDVRAHRQALKAWIAASGVGIPAKEQAGAGGGLQC